MTAKHTTTRLAHPGGDPRCKVCFGESYLVVREGAFATAKLCTCVRACPDCRGTGFVARSGEPNAVRRRCRCYVLNERIRRFAAARIPARHAHCTLVNFEKSGKNFKSFQSVFAWSESYRPREDNRGLVLFGEVGRGKTHLLVALLREVIFQHGVSARFVEFSHLIADLKSTFDRGSGTGELLDPLAKVDVLAIDELGKGRNTEWEGTVVDELISRRYNAAATILGTSNYAPGPVTGRAVPNLTELHGGGADAATPRLADRVGDRVYSRLEEMCSFVELRGGDYRQRGRPWQD